MNALRPALSAVWHDILLVWSFFTRIPAPHFATERKLSQALWALPLVGLVIWLVLLIALTLVGQLGVVALGMDRNSGSVLESFHVQASGSISGYALVNILVPILLTGALHWDGLADLFDGLGVARMHRAEVMRDSAIGTFGVLALISVFALQWHFYDVGDWKAMDLLLILIASRSIMALNWALVPAKDPESQTNRHGRPSWFPQALFFAFCCAGFLLTGSLSGVGTVLLVAALLGWCLLVRRWIGGTSGDGLGAIQVLSETSLIVCVAVF